MVEKEQFEACKRCSGKKTDLKKYEYESANEFGIILTFFAGCSNNANTDSALKKSVQDNKSFAFVKKRALEIIETGFNASEGYGEVWIRNYNTFII